MVLKGNPLALGRQLCSDWAKPLCSEQMKDLQAETPPTADPAGTKPVKFLIYSQEQAFRHMTRWRPEPERALYTLVDDLLFSSWDALSLSIDEEHRDVYYPYLPHVFDLLMTSEDGHEVVDYLLFIEETQMGAIRGDTLAQRRAWRLVELLLGHRRALFTPRQSPASPAS